MPTTRKAAKADQVFRVRLKRPVTIDGVPYLPRHLHEMTGALLDRVPAEDVASVEEVGGS